MGLFVSEWLDRVKFGENGPAISKVENWCEIASDDNACYDYPVSGKLSLCKAWVLKHLHAWRPKVKLISIFTLTDVSKTTGIIAINP